MLTVTFVLGMLMLFGTFVASNTLCRAGYMSRFISSSAVTSKLDKTFDNRINALSKETSLPSDIFYKARDEFAASDNVTVRFYKGYDTSLYSTEKVETVAGYCREYLNTTQTKYTNRSVDEIAKKAVNIYNETYGLENTQEAYQYVETIKAVSNKIYSSSLIFIAGSAMLISFFYSSKVERRKALMSQFNAAAYTFVLVSVFCLIFGVGTHVKANPSVYATAIANAVRADFVLFLIIGLIFTALSVFFSPKVFDKVKK